MLLWFAIVGPVLVAEIFRSPKIDYRLVSIAAVVPVVDVVIGSVSFLHSLVTPVVTLTVIMMATVPTGPVGGRLRAGRLLRRRLLGIPIGLFMHLVLDASWSTSRLFWWPLLGSDLRQVDLPESSGVTVRLLLDVVAVAVAFWAYRRYELDNIDNRHLLVSQGHLARRALS